jgi:pimeloyl-ACP methyl ester carboxylesterase
MDGTLIPTPAGRIHHRRWRPSRPGAGVPLVLLHDSLGCVALWRDFPATLAEATGREVVAYDRLGFGNSDPHPGPLPSDFIEAEAEGAFRALVEHLGLGAFVLVGHSVGGGMAAACAAAFPGTCRALVTESAQAFVEPRTLEGIRASQLDFARPDRMKRLARYHGDKAAWVLEAWTGTWLSKGFRNWRMEGVLAKVGCPVLAIHGDRDEFGSLEHPARIVAWAGGPARQRILAGCGHVPHRERPGEVVSLILRFLTESGV